MDKKLKSVLAARDLRWNLRFSMASASRGCLISVTLRVPWEYRISRDFLQLMEGLCGFLRHKLTSQEICIDDSRWIKSCDGPALLLSVSSSPERIKRLSVGIEEDLLGGQLLDIDVMNTDGTVVSREQLGLPPRKCFICDNPAKICASRRLHSQEELAVALERLSDLALSRETDGTDD